MPKGHKPKAASRAYTIFGPANPQGSARVRNAQRTQQNDMNDEFKTRRCVGCGAKRKPRSGPFCPNCTSTNTERH